jgi:hypothetical protein
MSAEEFMAARSPDPTATGYVPSVGEHVFCYRPSDGKSHCGFVDDNKMGLFLTTCHSGKHVLTAARWNVQPLAPTSSCLTDGTQTSPSKGDQVT